MSGDDYVLDRWQRIIPRRLRDARPDNLDSAEKREVVEWWRNHPNSTVLLLGKVGRGKSWTAVACGWLLHKHLCHPDGRDPVAWWPVMELLRSMTPYGPNPRFDAVVAAPLLILDGLGEEPVSDWKAGRLYDIVNRRWLNCSPTIASSNLDADALPDAVTPRVYSRLRDDARAWALGGPDRRRPHNGKDPAA